MKRSFYIVLGCFLTSVGTSILHHSHVLTGGTAGLSLIMSYLSNLPFGVVFFLINIPFYVLSVRNMGWNFTLSTILSVTLLSAMTVGMDWILPSFSIPMSIGAVTGGVIIGFGLSTLFMNRASLGGFNILALILQKRRNWNPGIINFILDFVVVSLGFYSIGFWQGLLSILSIAITSSIISYFKNKIAISNKSTASNSHVNRYPVKTTIGMN
ncbi:YitT family protein [Anoxybacillus sp. J5B_2022]|uniref:YitT family protein n=1 Tax=Anoxybacillus sp. J5B_2022 TaxID=3003246 RepID=UPI0022865BD7|nr:YitT family protein [Anoxybacillus sp. J5B_2022]MCZ0756634.1 YitT family protein [Anoxybacillus sp. J5B_2022]